MSCEINETLWKHGYELTNQIGKGGFASVYSILSTKYQETYVAKTIQNDTSKRNGNSNSFLSEIEALKSIVHPNIVSIYNHFTDSSFFYIILEFCPGGNLGEFIRKHGVLTRNDFFNYSRQILNALHYMHLRKMAHRDIKPANIFLDAYGRVKLGDFGLAITSNELCKTFSGSQAFQAPEIVKKLPFCPMKADIWAFGVTMYYLAIGDLPWGFQSKNVLKVIENGIVIIPSTIDPYIYKFLKMVLISDPNYRPTSSDLMKCELLNCINKIPLSSSAKNCSIPASRSTNKSAGLYLMKSIKTLRPYNEKRMSTVGTKSLISTSFAEILS